MQPESIDSPLPEPSSAQRTRKRRRWYKRLLRSRLVQRQGNRIVIAVAAILAVSIISVLVLITDASNRVNLEIRNTERVLSVFSQTSGATLSLSDVDRLYASLSALQQTLDGVGARIGFLRPLGYLDVNLSFGFDSLEASKLLVSAARGILDGLQPALLFAAGNEEDGALLGELSSGQRVAELLQLGQVSFRRAQENLVAAQAMLDQASAQALNQANLLTLSRLQVYSKQLQQINDILVISPELITLALGIQTERSYLVLAQNNDEIRPSGGYVSTYGWMTVRNGRIVAYDYQATTSTTPNPPAEQFASEIIIPEWWIQYRNPIAAAWDGSWSADFAETAERAMWYYNNGNNPQAPVDGVIGIDISAFERILQALGQVEVEGYDQVVNASDFRDVIYDIRASGEGNAPHKRFLAALYAQIFEDWLLVGNRDAQQGAALMGAVLQSLQEKNIMLYFADPQLQNTMNLLGWSGRQQAAEQADYLMVVDANMGNKSNASIVRQTTYDVSLLDDGSSQGRLSISYDYSASRASTDPAVDAAFHGPLDYASIVQIFIPFSSVVEDAVGFARPVSSFESNGAAMITSLVRVPYDSVPRIQLSYRTPVVVQQIGSFWRYSLQLQKQPGMRSETVNVLVTLPANATIVSANPEPAVTYQLERQIIEFRLNLRRDERIEVVYEAQ